MDLELCGKMWLLNGDSSVETDSKLGEAENFAMISDNSLKVIFHTQIPIIPFKSHAIYYILFDKKFELWLANIAWSYVWSIAPFWQIKHFPENDVTAMGQLDTPDIFSAVMWVSASTRLQSLVMVMVLQLREV